MCDEEFGSVSEKDTNKVVAVIYNWTIMCNSILFFLIT
jgi:hypothetical protein